MPKYRVHIFLLLPLLLGIIVMGTAHRSHAKPGLWQVPKLCTLGHYRPQAKRLNAIADNENLSDRQKGGHKRGSNQVVVYVILPCKTVFSKPVFLNAELPQAILPKAYTYLFFEEINPPPPDHGKPGLLLLA